MLYSNKYYNLIQHMYQDNLLVTSSKYFNGLAADVQKAIMAAAKDSNEYCRTLSLQLEEQLMKDGRDKYKVEFISPDLTGFRAAVEGFIDEFPHVKKWYDKASVIE